MNFTEWSALPENERKQKCQYLDPYDDQDLFKGVENAFREAYGEQPGVNGVHCGLGPFIGPYNCIVVDMTEGQSEPNLPEVFLGFPVITESEGK
jgi:hypothetical protein